MTFNCDYPNLRAVRRAQDGAPCEWLGEASALVVACEEVDGEGDFFVGEKIPADAVEGVAIDAGYAEAFPG